MWGLNIPNVISFHEDDYIVSYCYKSSIIYGDMSIRSWGSGLNSQKICIELNATSGVFMFFKNRQLLKYWYMEKCFNKTLR